MHGSLIIVAGRMILSFLFSFFGGEANIEFEIIIISDMNIRKYLNEGKFNGVYDKIIFPSKENKFEIDRDSIMIYI